MPRLGSFLVCEKIIIDQQQKPSLIQLFQGITALLPEGQAMPKDTLSGNAWSIFAEWFFAEDELTKSFEQVVEVLMPDGTPTPIRGRLLLKEVAKEGQGTRAYVNLFGMPIAHPGFLAVNIWLELNSERVTDVFTYHIKVEHASKTPGNDSGMYVPAMTQTKPS